MLEAEDITVEFGGIKALNELSFNINEGEILGLIGPNGAGKTTMFNVLSRVSPTRSRPECGRSMPHHRELKLQHCST